VRRREFITLLGGAAVVAWWPVVVRAQQSAHVPVIGFLGFGPASGFARWVEALRQGLRDLGYIEGKNIVIEFRWADSVDQLPEFATELVRMNVDIIFASSSTLVVPARQATKTMCLPSMPIPSAWGTLRVSRGPAEISRDCRCFSPISSPRS
jgi:putative ABC transport system substrate-binding protein